MAPVLRASSSFGSASLCPGASTLRQGHIVAKVPARRQSINPLAAKVVVPELGKIGSPEFEAIRNGTFKWSGEVFKKYKEKFQPVTKKPEVPVILDFEKPLFALENKIKEVKHQPPGVSPPFVLDCHRKAFCNSVRVMASPDRRWCDCLRNLHVRTTSLSSEDMCTQCCLHCALPL